MKFFLYIMVVLLVTGCKEKYDPPVQSPVTGYLVVDGVINSGPGAAAITLSRTTKFENKNMEYEKGALVKLEGEDNSMYTLVEKPQGQYSIDNISLDAGKKYRLRITVTGSKVYLSDFTTVKNNPPIDSISWKRQDDGVQLYVNTHDPLNNTRYYQWTYDETWQIQSDFVSTLKYKITSLPGEGQQYSVVYRDSSTFSFDSTIINCWQFNSPTNLSLGSTAKESQDIVYLPIAFVPKASIKLGVLYSLHIKQTTWSKEGYEFLERMKKNTESTGMAIFIVLQMPVNRLSVILIFAPCRKKEFLFKAAKCLPGAIIPVVIMFYLKIYLTVLKQMAGGASCQRWFHQVISVLFWQHYLNAWIVH